MRDGGSFRDAFITVLLLHVIGVLAIMTYGSFKKVVSPPKTAKQAESQTHQEPAQPELIASGAVQPGARLEPVREKDPFTPKPPKIKDTTKTKSVPQVAKGDEPLPPLVSRAAKAARPAVAKDQLGGSTASSDKAEATKRAFLEATGRLPEGEATPAVSEPEARPAEAVVAKVAEPSPPPAQNAAPAPTEVVVGNGDNIYTVSKRLNVSYAELAKANNLAGPRDLRVGQTLVVPRKGDL